MVLIDLIKVKNIRINNYGITNLSVDLYDELL